MVSVRRIVQRWVRWLARLTGYGPWQGAGVGAPAVMAEEPDDQRLRRLALWCLTGQAAAAELELHQWRHAGQCPAVAVALLVGLLNKRAGAGLADWLVDNAPSHHGQIDPAIADALDVGVPRSPAAMLGDAVERLSEALVSEPALVRSLVAAALVDESSGERVGLMRDALRSAYVHERDADRKAVFCEALAELGLAGGDARDAREWAQRGWRLRPGSARLALVLARVADGEDGPSARRVLAEVATAKPGYVDVRAALIRREFADGLTASARLRLAQWEASGVGHPVIEQLEREMAA